MPYSNLIDLSHTIDQYMPIWPGDPLTEFITVANRNVDGFYLRKISIGEHTGTHLTAPLTFHPNGSSIDQYPLESLIAPGVTIDISDRTSMNPDYTMSAAQFLLDHRGIHGLGIDTHGIDPGLDNTFSVSKLMLQEPRIVLANLTNLNKLPAKGFTLTIAILKFQGGSGSPAHSAAGKARRPQRSRHPCETHPHRRFLCLCLDRCSLIQAFPAAVRRPWE